MLNQPWELKVQTIKKNVAHESLEIKTIVTLMAYCVFGGLPTKKQEQDETIAAQELLDALNKIAIRDWDEAFKQAWLAVIHVGLEARNINLPWQGYMDEPWMNVWRRELKKWNWDEQEMAHWVRDELNRSENRTPIWILKMKEIEQKGRTKKQNIEGWDGLEVGTKNNKNKVWGNLWDAWKDQAIDRDEENKQLQETILEKLIREMEIQKQEDAYRSNPYQNKQKVLENKEGLTLTWDQLWIPKGLYTQELWKSQEIQALELNAKIGDDIKWNERRWDWALGMGHRGWIVKALNEEINRKDETFEKKAEARWKSVEILWKNSSRVMQNVVKDVDWIQNLNKFTNEKSDMEVYHSYYKKIKELDSLESIKRWRFDDEDELAFKDMKKNSRELKAWKKPKEKRNESGWSQGWETWQDLVKFEETWSHWHEVKKIDPWKIQWRGGFVGTEYESWVKRWGILGSSQGQWQWIRQWAQEVRDLSEKEYGKWKANQSWEEYQGWENFLKNDSDWWIWASKEIAQVMAEKRRVKDWFVEVVVGRSDGVALGNLGEWVQAMINDSGVWKKNQDWIQVWMEQKPWKWHPNDPWIKKLSESVKGASKEWWSSLMERRELDETLNQVEVLKYETQGLSLNTLSMSSKAQIQDEKEEPKRNKKPTPKKTQKSESNLNIVRRL